MVANQTRAPTPPGPGLAEVLARAGADLTPLHYAAVQPVRSVVLRDRGGEQDLPPHALVLAVGYEAGDPLFVQLMRAAASAQAAAVIAKPSTCDVDELKRLGENHGVSTVLAPSAVDWLTLASRLKSACVLAADVESRDYTGDLFAFANAVAVAAGGAAAIVGPAGEILGFSNLPGQPIDDLRLQTTVRLEELEAPASDPDYALVYSASGCVYFASDDASMFDRVAAAVRSGGEILGSIWVLVSDPVLGPDVEEAVSALLDEAAFHLHHARLDATAQQDGDALLLEKLLSGEALAEASADALGISGQKWFRLALLANPTTPGPLSRRQIQAVTHWLRIAHRSAVSTETKDGLVILFSGTSEDYWSSAALSLQRFFGASELTHREFSIATSLPVNHPRSIRAEFDRLLILSSLAAAGSSEGSDRSGVVRMEDRWAAVELTHIAGNYSEPASDRLDILRRIEEFDRAHHTEYWSTLRVYALANRSYVDAATQLHVHPNTVRYRIERVNEMFGLDIRDVQTFAWVVIQCHLPPRSDRAIRA